MKIGLALGGGGAKGSYQLGVIKALSEAGILNQVQVISGTSIGAINTLLVMGNLSVDEMITIWEKFDNKTIYKEGFGRIVKDRQGIFDMKYIYDDIYKVLDRKKIKESKIRGYAQIVEVANPSLIGQLDLWKMKSKSVCLNTARDPHKIVLASSSIPLIFGPTKIQEHNYVDGGMKNNVPIPILLEQGCDVIFVVSLSPRFKTTKYDEKATIINMTPTKPLGRMPLVMFDFSKGKITDRVEMGYNNAKSLINYLKENQILSEDNVIVDLSKKTYSLNDIPIIDKDDINNKVIKEVKS